MNHVALRGMLIRVARVDTWSLVDVLGLYLLGAMSGSMILLQLRSVLMSVV